MNGAVALLVHCGDRFVVEAGAEFLRLRHHHHHEVRALDAVGEAGEILDGGGGAELAARLGAGEDERTKIGAGSVDGSGVARAPRPDDDHILHAG